MGLVSLVRGYRKVGGGGVFSFPFFPLFYYLLTGLPMARHGLGGRLMGVEHASTSTSFEAIFGE